MPTAIEEAVLPKLSNDEIARYSRHLILPEVGMEGQQKLKAAKVLCVGTGGLGAPLAMYLAAAGVGTIGLVDFDTVDASNLQRQIIHSTATVGKLKVDSAELMLKGLNPYLNVVKHNTMLTSANALEILKDYDVIADGTDNFQTRYLVNDACVLLGKPNAYGSIFRFEGQASVFGTKEGPCYRCLYPEPPPPGLVPSCAEGGVLGILPGLVGVIQATETIKLILGIGEPLIGRLLLVDALGMSFRTLKLRKNPQCPVCGPNPTLTELIDYNQFCGIAPPSEVGPLEVAHDKAVAEHPVVDGIPQITVEELKRKLDAKEDVFVLDVREPHEYQIANLGVLQIPVGSVESRLGELAGRKNDEIIIHCRSGARSQKASLILKNAGFTNVSNLTGGILAWADKIDPSMPKY
ncbi:MAG TPA: molybdopterin-synthase adenylyltransferase MoeB [Edaphobacter sp.]|jgi:molybdopterin/thiamine biosynthesis adenylyltransferase/rhodanese-related sulfurtransferase|nr:molybdopterin-synthase adenylyltransferase MoeB [Edaphobacter sp.]